MCYYPDEELIRNFLENEKIEEDKMIWTTHEGDFGALSYEAKND